jgi:hypothetical protein
VELTSLNTKSNKTMMQDSTIISSASGFSHYSVCHTPRTKKLIATERGMRVLRRENYKLSHRQSGDNQHDDDDEEQYEFPDFPSTLRTTTPSSSQQDDENSMRSFPSRKLDPFPCDLSSISSDDEPHDDCRRRKKGLVIYKDNDEEDDNEDGCSSEEASDYELSPITGHFIPSRAVAASHKLSTTTTFGIFRSLRASPIFHHKGNYKGFLLVAVLWLSSTLCWVWNDSTVLPIPTEGASMAPKRAMVEGNHIVTDPGVTGVTAITAVTERSNNLNSSSIVAHHHASSTEVEVLTAANKKKKNLSSTLVAVVNSENIVPTPQEYKGVVYYPCDNGKGGSSYFAFICPNPDFNNME